ncbi:MAG: hypothetical protein ABIH46_10495, partial [Chloroflexota bacterium]
SKAMLYVAGAASLLLGALWISAGTLPLLESTLVLSDWLDTRILPVLSFPRLSLSSLGFYSAIDFIPDFNLFEAVPIALGVLFVLVGDGLFSGQRAAVCWLLIAVGIALACMHLYSSTRMALQAMLSLGAVAIVGALLGWGATRQEEVLSDYLPEL